MSKWIKSLAVLTILTSNLLPAQKVLAEDTTVEENTENTILSDNIDNEVVNIENKSNVLEITDLSLTSIDLSDETAITFSMITDSEALEGNLTLVFNSINSHQEIMLDLQFDSETMSYLNTLHWDQDYTNDTYKLSKVLIDKVETEVAGVVFEDVVFHIGSDEDKTVQLNDEVNTDNTIDEAGEVKSLEEESILIQEDSFNDNDDTTSENIVEADNEIEVNQDESSQIFTSDLISMNQKEFTRGETLKSEVDIENDYIQAIEVNFKSENYRDFKMTLSKKYNSNIFTGERLIGDDLYSGNYYISDVLITFSDGNSERYWNEKNVYEENLIDFSNLDFTINNTLPEHSDDLILLSNVKVQSTFVEKGDIQQVTINKNFDNEIKSVQVNFWDIERGIHYSVDSIYTVKDDQLFLEFEIDEILAEGRWKINNLSLSVEYLTNENHVQPEYRNYSMRYEEYYDVNYHFLNVNKPLIELDREILLTVGESFDIYDYLTVTDNTDGDITHQAVIELNDFSASERGNYQGNITVENSFGVTSEQRFYIRVINPEITDIEIVSHPNRLVLNVGDKLSLETFEIKLKTIDIYEEVTPTPIWFSKDPSILEITDYNEVKAVNPGLTYLFVESHNQIDGILVQINGDKALFPEIISGKKTILNKTYSGDIYIDHFADVVFNNVTVNGNIFVDGQLKLNNSNIAGNVYSDFFELIENKDMVKKNSHTFYNEDTTINEKFEFDRKQFYANFPNDELFSINNELYLGGYFLDRYTLKPLAHISYYPDIREGLSFYKGKINSTGDSYITLTSIDTWKSYDFPVKNYKYIENGILQHEPLTENDIVGVGVYTENFNEYFRDNKIDINKDKSMIFSIKLMSDEKFPENFSFIPTWYSDDESMVTIMSVRPKDSTYEKSTFDIEVKGVDRGTVNIYTKIGNETYSIEVTVNDPQVLDFSFKDEIIEIYTDDEKIINDLDVETIDDPDYRIELFSKDQEILLIDGQRIIGRSMGETTLTAKIGNMERDIRVKVNPIVQYQTHIQSYGWDNYVRDGGTSGTVGQAKRLEGIIIDMPNTSKYGNIEYRTHVEKYGWMDWKQNGEMSGTEGEAKRLEAIQIRLTDELDEHYDIYYRVHAQSYGWLDWAKNGEEAGTAGLGKRLEGIEVQLVEKGEQAPGSTDKPYVDGNLKLVEVPSVTYTTHVQSYGWQDAVKDGKMSGTSGEAKRLESIKIDLENLPYAGDIAYTTHVQSYGWQDSVKNGKMSGTSGEAKRLEAIRIALTGELAEHYDVYYRVHAQSYGWLGWAKNGASSGTEGLAKRLEGIEIKLVKKGGQAPGSTAELFIK